MAFIYVEESDLTWAAQQGLIQSNEVNTLWPALVKRAQGRGGINLAQVSFYAGSLIIIGALTWFMTMAWSWPPALFFLALVYVTLFGSAGLMLWNNGYKWGIPQVVAGLFVTIAVSVAPVATYAAQEYLNQWPISPGIFIELTAIVGGAVALYFVRFPFLTAPISLALYFLADIDLPLAIWANPTSVQLASFSFAFGVAMDVVAFFIDRQKFKADFAFWLYLFGSMASFGAISFLFFVDVNELGPYNCFYIVFAILYLVCSSLVNRQVLVVFGALATTFYLFWLTNSVFWNSWAYPFALTAVGLLVIFLGVQLQKYLSNKDQTAATAAKEPEAEPEAYQPVPMHEMPFMHAPVHVPMHFPMQQQPVFFMPPGFASPAPAAAPKVADDV